MLLFVSLIFLSRIWSCSRTFCKAILADGESFLFKTVLADSDDIPPASSTSTTTAESTCKYNGISHSCRSTSLTSYPRTHNTSKFQVWHAHHTAQNKIHFEISPSQVQFHVRSVNYVIHWKHQQYLLNQKITA